MQFFQTTNIDFIGKRKIAYTVSSALILAGLFSLFFPGRPNWGIDFKGGTSIIVRFEKPVTTSEIRKALSTINLGTSEIKKFAAENEYLIYVAQQKEASASEIAKGVEDAISSSLPDKPYEILQTETIGPKIGEELRKTAVYATLASLVLILIYVGWRFEFVFAAGAVIALFHDVMVTFGILCILKMEISLREVAAFLTIVGYSINDTIVIYDRIRENFKIMRNEELDKIINVSVNQCLGRTIITSLTVFFVVFILLLFGGEVIRGFAFAMTVGVITGSYSTIYVASSLVLDWQNRHGGKQVLKMSRRK
jgi:preprotein translocase subunit SecF